MNRIRKSKPRKILIIIDMQKYIIGIKRELEPAEVKEVLKAVLEKIGQYEAKNIIATRETVGEYKEGNPEQEIEDAITELIKGATIINKPQDCSVELAKMIRKLAKRWQLDIEMIGVLTDRCVTANALLLKAIVPDAKIRVDSTCCFGTDWMSHHAALKLLKENEIEVVAY